MTWLIILPLAGLAGFVQSFTGFGAAAILMTVLPYAFSLLRAPGITQIICTFLAATMAWHFRKSINLKMMLLPTIIYTAASLAVVPVVKGLDLHVLTIVFGGFLVALSIYSLTLDKKLKVSGSLGALIGCSALSGVLSGLFGVGGPTMALYLFAVSKSKEEYLGTLQLLFVISNLAVTASRIANGIITADILPICAVGAVGILAGKHLGYKVGDKLDADKTRIAVNLCVGFSGIFTILQQTVLK